MTTLEKQKLALKNRLAQNIGRRIESTHHLNFRSDETAEIVGWGLRSETGSPIYYVRYDDGECTTIPAGRLFNSIGYAFVED